MASLTTNARKQLPTSAFALSGRRYPIDTPARARNALARVAQDGTATEQAEVRRAVLAKYPTIDQESRQATPSRPPHDTAKKVHAQRMAQPTSMGG